MIGLEITKDKYLKSFKMHTTLDILIPTYNRIDFLKKNINLLKEYLDDENVNHSVNIIISNNCSTDSTKAILEQVLQDCRSFKVYNQSENIGLENNALFCLKKSTADYVMYLGDDDYLTKDYILKVLDKIKANDIAMIIPSFHLIDPNGKRKGVLGRDTDLPNKLYPAGEKTCIEMSLKCHQLSGVTYRRYGLYDRYVKSKLSTLYPFIYWGCISSIEGNVWHLTENPILVTQVEQTKKDWGYGEDGLLIDKIKCFYHAFPENILLRHKLEMKALSIQGIGLLKYLRKSVRAYFKVFSILRESDYVTNQTKKVTYFLSVLNPILQVKTASIILFRKGRAYLKSFGS
ncbi:glycosyltransferase family 2 protein [Endozoicomonas sp. ONNA2]|uniref:glycosyltransferase family 2 protein n=1 Tax=Endozoicomonas sp. ONNA2 TaxID=2828741 RepID=UPI0021486BE9|nr:glycosyltransferase family 2 protein [Endozoicomonas sp. ONNA2]